jgi:hypothetical protein
MPKGKVVMEGQLLKWTNYLYRWQPRQCKVTSDGIFYYGKAGGKQQAIPISECRFAMVKNDPLRFRVFFETRKIGFKAQEASMASKWLGALKAERNKSRSMETIGTSQDQASSLKKAEERVSRSLLAVEKQLNGTGSSEMNELRSALRELKAAYGGEAGTPTDWRPRPARQPDLRVETEPADANHKGVVGSYVSTFTSPNVFENRDKHFRFLYQEEESEDQEENYSFDIDEPDFAEDGNALVSDIQAGADQGAWPLCLHPLKQVLFELVI